MKKKTPLHIVLKQYRVVYLTLAGFIVLLVYRMWTFFELNYTGLTAESAAVFSAAFLAVIPMLKYVLENSRQDSSHDDHCDGEEK